MTFTVGFPYKTPLKLNISTFNRIYNEIYNDESLFEVHYMIKIMLYICS